MISTFTEVIHAVILTICVISLFFKPEGEIHPCGTMYVRLASCVANSGA